MKLRKHITSTFFVFSVVFFTSTAAQASIVEIAISATVYYLRDDGHFLEGKINFGDTITGSYKYESTTLDSSPSDPVVGHYWHYVSPYGVSLTVGGFNFKTNPDNVSFLVGIGNEPSDDIYWFTSYNNLPLADGTVVGPIDWQLDDYTATAFSSDALPTTAPILNQWQSNNLDISTDKYGIWGHVTSAKLVPEPATILLLGLGVMFLKKRN